MGEFLTLFDGISGWSWGWLLAAFIFALTLESWPHIRYSYWQWRIDRLLRREGGAHPEELRDLQWHQNEEPERFDILRVLSVSFQMTLQLALPVVLVDVVSADDLALAPAAVAAAVLFAQNRGRIGEEEQEGEAPGPTVYPCEAKIGLAFALVVSVGLLFYITQVMQP